MDGFLEKDDVSIIYQLGTNPPLLSDIREGRRGFSLPAIILEIILYEALHREIGQNQLREDG